MNNVIKSYICKTEKRFKKYFSMILKSKYDVQIATELINTYVEGRYYNYFETTKGKVFYKNIQSAIIRKGRDLKDDFPNREEKIDYAVSLFPYFFYFDYVRDNVSIQNIIKQIDEKRKNVFKIRNAETDNFIANFTKLVENDLKDIESEIAKYNTKDFELRVKKLQSKNNVLFEAMLDYKITFPEIFSEEFVRYTFDSDIIAEDKLFVEYPMIANVALVDILQCNFSKKYFVEFAPSLLKKEKKFEKTIEILDNQATQNKVYFEIQYDDFIEVKKEIFKLIKRGFKFVLLTNNEMEKLKKDDLKILDVFDYIIPDEEDINRKAYNKSKIIEK